MQLLFTKARALPCPAPGSSAVRPGGGRCPEALLSGMGAPDPPMFTWVPRSGKCWFPVSGTPAASSSPVCPSPRTRLGGQVPVQGPHFPNPHTLQIHSPVFCPSGVAASSSAFSGRAGILGRLTQAGRGAQHPQHRPSLEMMPPKPCPASRACLPLA